MREILFRGKRVDNGEWVEGDLIRKYGYTHIVVKLSIKKAVGRKDIWIEYIVTPESVGQFTGLLDKNGKKIFDGDLLSCSNWICNCQVIFIDGGFTIKEGETFFNLKANFEDEYGFEIDDIEVIGNVHDNPELLNK